MHVKKPEISLLGSEILFSVPVLTQKQDNLNKENVNTTRWAKGVGHRSDYKSHPTVIHLGIYSHKVSMTGVTLPSDLHGCAKNVAGK